MNAGKEREMYNQGYRDGYNDGENAHIAPCYWTKLEHQYAGMAMQGVVRTVGHDRMYPPEKIAIYAEACAHALIEKLKEKEGK